VLGVPVDTWWIYLFIVLYQLTRATMGSLVKNIFTPFYNRIVNSQELPHASTRARFLRGSALIDIFIWWSALSDVLISAAQVDLALCTLLSGIAADYAQLVYRYSEMEHSQPQQIISRVARIPFLTLDSS
jgi:hypothetical protein